MLSASATSRSCLTRLVPKSNGLSSWSSSSLSLQRRTTTASSLFRSVHRSVDNSAKNSTAIPLSSAVIVPGGRFSSVSQIVRRKFSDAAADGAATKSPWLEPLKETTKNYWKHIIGGLVFGTGLLQIVYGKETDFYDRRFVLDIDPDNLADFYGSENFMDLYSVLPIMGELMMRGGYFDDEGTVHTQGLPFGEMLVSMVFSDSDDDGDGNEDSKWFNKRERFKNECFGGNFMMWDMITNFGFETLPDGRVMVYHHGEYFNGYLPPFSLIVGTVFRIHSWFVIKTTEHHLRYYAFRNDTEIDEKMEHESRDAMPIFWLKNYNWFKVLGYLFLNHELDMPDKLKKKRDEAMAIYKAENPDEDEEAEEEEEEEEDEEVVAAKLARKKTIAETVLSKKHTLPTQRPEVMRQIEMDIAMDKAHAKATLGGAADEEEEVGTNTNEEKDEDDEAMDAILASKKSSEEDTASPTLMAKKRATLRRIKTSTALRRYQTALQRRMTNAGGGGASPVGADGELLLKRISTKKTMQDFSGLDDKNLDDVDNYKAVGMAARAKLLQRRSTKASMKRRGTSLA